MPSSPSTPRPRGAPRGNRNAVKHGFYARRLPKTDLTDLERAEFTGLMDEIKLLRVYIRRVIELGQQSDDIYETLAILRAICLASDSLNRLLKTQHFLGAGEDDVSIAIREAIATVSAEWTTDEDNAVKSPLLALRRPTP